MDVKLPVELVEIIIIYIIMECLGHPYLWSLLTLWYVDVWNSTWNEK